MINCKKRQKCVKDGVIYYRCINNRSELYGQVVDSICEKCPYNDSNSIIFEWNKECGVCPRREPIDGKTARCRGTGLIVSKRECRICLQELAAYNLDPDEIAKQYDESKEGKSYPAFLEQVNNYRLAVMRWIKAGKPTRTDKEIKRLHETFCMKCDWYDSKSKRCKGCGCRVATKGPALTNKLKMATEHCPKDLF